MVLGPNYNQPAGADRAKKAIAFLSKAHAAPNASPVERALIAALDKRYTDPPPAADDTKGQSALDEAYANAMRAVAKQYPNDDDVQVLFAESMMDLRPWRLWEPDGKAAPGTDEILATLENVLARNPQHPGANHYYIHAVEASPHPEKALAAADRVGNMMPGAGHLVHMPSHVYQRVGRYNDAAEANRKAIDADKKYTGTIGDPGYYAMYVAHNFQFLWAAALMAGRGDESVGAARDMLKLVPAEMWKQMPEVSFAIEAPALSLVRFGRWKEVLDEKAPPVELPMPTILWHYARGRALAALGKLDEADAEAAAMQKIVTTLPKTAVAGFTPGNDYAGVAIDLVRGDVACRRGKVAAGLEAPRKSGRHRRRLPLRRAARLVLPAAPDARRVAAPRAQGGRRAEGVRGRSAQEPRQRLGAHRPARSAARAEEADRRRRRAPRQGVVERRRQSRLLRLLASYATIRLYLGRRQTR